MFIWRKARHRVAKADGPERIHGEWWISEGETKLVRDYYRVETADGTRYWLFRDGPTEQGGSWWLLSMHRRIEVLITVINMPGMDGFELAERAKGMREGLKVILLSGRENNGSGFPFIPKPFLTQDLKRTMARHTGLC
jgi:CheY-like chemotaxis protein